MPIKKKKNVLTSEDLIKLVHIFLDSEFDPLPVDIRCVSNKMHTPRKPLEVYPVVDE